MKSIWSHLEEIFPFHVFDPETQMSRGEEVQLPDFIALLKILEMYKPLNILEIGAWTGSCTCLFGKYVKEYGGKVHSIDNFNGSPGSTQWKYAQVAKRRFFENIKNYGLEDTVVFHEGSSDDFADMDMKFDLIFIDADHRYSQISKDLNNYFSKLNDGGVISGHDFDAGFYDEKHIEDDFVGGIHHGVTKAVTEKFPNVKLFTTEEDGKRRLISTIWFSVAKAPCLVAMD